MNVTAQSEIFERRQLKGELFYLTGFQFSLRQNKAFRKKLQKILAFSLFPSIVCGVVQSQLWPATMSAKDIFYSEKYFDDEFEYRWVNNFRIEFGIAQFCVNVHGMCKGFAFRVACLTKQVSLTRWSLNNVKNSKIWLNNITRTNFQGHFWQLSFRFQFIFGFFVANVPTNVFGMNVEFWFCMKKKTNYYAKISYHMCRRFNPKSIQRTDAISHPNITYIFCRFFFEYCFYMKFIEIYFVLHSLHYQQTRRAAQRIGTAHTKDAFNVRERVASDWRSTVQRMGALHDSYAWTTYSSISATNYESRVKLWPIHSMRVPPGERFPCSN